MEESAIARKEAAQKAVQANKDHQHALNLFTTMLETELKSLEKLLISADVDQEDDLEQDMGGHVIVSCLKKASSPVPPAELFCKDSSFYDDAKERHDYLTLISAHPMKPKELEALSEGVKAENYRKHALAAQQKGRDAIFNVSGFDAEQNTEDLDWSRIAEKVTEVSGVLRTARQCEISWLGDRHPSINHASWSAKEIAQLRQKFSEIPAGQVNWAILAEKLGTHRTPIDCMRHAIPRNNHIWDSAADKRLFSAVRKYGQDNWTLVAMHVSEDATAQQCQGRYIRCVDPTLKRGPWLPDEDKQLDLAVSAYGNSWIDVATFIDGRNNEQCRDRWLDRQKPNFRQSRWLYEEDNALADAVSVHGENWAAVCQVLGNGRTEAVCQSRYEVVKRRIVKMNANASSTAGTPSATATSPSVPTNSPLPTQASQQSATNNESPEPPLPPPSKPRPKPRMRNKGKGKALAPELDEHAEKMSMDNVQGSFPSDQTRPSALANEPKMVPRGSVGQGKRKRIDADGEDVDASSVVSVPEGSGPTLPKEAKTARGRGRGRGRGRAQASGAPPRRGRSQKIAAEAEPLEPAHSRDAAEER